MKNSKKGFTLFEILTVVTIMAILGVSSIISFNKSITNTNIEKYNNLKEEIIESAKVYIETDSGLMNSLNYEGSIKVTVGELQELTLINWNLKNPVTKENISSQDYVYAYKNYKGELEYEYISQDYDYKVYGVEFNLNTGVYTRTDNGVGLNYTVGTSEITSDFDNAEIYKEMAEVTDSYGNIFIKIPKFYIKKTVNTDKTIWKYQISKEKKDDGYYLPACFMDETLNKELPYVLVGKYNASLSTDGTKLESKSGKVALVNKTITECRNYAKANGSEYQLLDIHIVDVLQTLFYTEFATLDSQSIMAGFSNGVYVSTDIISSISGTTLTLPSGRAAEYAIGQMIDIGTTRGGRQIARNLRIQGISGNTITYEIVNGISEIIGVIATNQMVYNVSFLAGLTDTVSTPSGSYINNINGKYSMKYREIENLYAGLWQFVDGVNIKNWVAYVAKDAKQYASDVFTVAYVPIGYTNSTSNGWGLKMGYDSNNPFLQLPVEVGASENNKYNDYYYQITGNKIVFFSGMWNYASYAGISTWRLDNTSSDEDIHNGSRLVKTPS